MDPVESSGTGSRSSYSQGSQDGDLLDVKDEAEGSLQWHLYDNGGQVPEDQRFERNRNLSERKVWTCPVQGCGRRYCHKGDLKYHVKKKHPNHGDLPGKISKSRTQIKDKPYCCTSAGCKSGYSRERDLKRHLKMKHGLHGSRRQTVATLPQFNPSVLDPYSQSMAYANYSNMANYMNNAMGYGMDMNSYYQNQYQQQANSLMAQAKPMSYPSYPTYDQSGQSLMPSMSQRVTQQGWSNAPMAQMNPQMNQMNPQMSQQMNQMNQQMNQQMSQHSLPSMNSLPYNTATANYGGPSPYYAASASMGKGTAFGHAVGPTADDTGAYGHDDADGLTNFPNKSLHPFIGPSDSSFL